MQVLCVVALAVVVAASDDKTKQKRGIFGENGGLHFAAQPQPQESGVILAAPYDNGEARYAGQLAQQQFLEAGPAPFIPQPAVRYAPQPALGYAPQPALGLGYAPQMPYGYGPQTSVQFVSEPAVRYAPQPAIRYAPQPALSFAQQQFASVGPAAFPAPQPGPAFIAGRSQQFLPAIAPPSQVQFIQPAPVQTQTIVQPIREVRVPVPVERRVPVDHPGKSFFLLLH